MSDPRAPGAPPASDAAPQDQRDLRHVSSQTPRVMVVDGSRLVRKLIGDVIDFM